MRRRRRRKGNRSKDGEAESERKRWGGPYLPLKTSDEKINTQETVLGGWERENERKSGGFGSSQV